MGQTCNVSVTVLAAVLALVGMPASAQPSRMLKVCVAQHTEPLALCTPDLDPATFSGYEVEAFRDAAPLMGWKEGVDFAFSCLPFGTMMDAIQSNSALCDVGLGAVTITTEREQAGINFTLSTFTTSLGVLVPAQVQSPDGWYFIRPFSWSVWLAIGLSVLAFPLVLFLVEMIYYQGKSNKEERRQALQDVYWHVSWGTLQQGFDPHQKESPPTRIMLLAYAAVALILVESYAANLTAGLTVSALQSSVNSIADLRGKAVGTEPVYKGRLAHAGIPPIVFQEPVTAQELGEGGPGDWLSALRMGTLAAFVLDEPLARWTDRVTGCEVRLLDETFEQFSYAFALPRNTSVSIYSLDNAILRLQEDGSLNTLRDAYIAFPPPKCAFTTGGKTSFSITFEQIWGLYVLWGGAVVIAILVLFWMIWRRRRRRRETHLQCGGISTVALAQADKLAQADRLAGVEDGKSGLADDASQGIASLGSGGMQLPVNGVCLAHGGANIEELLLQQLQQAQLAQQQLVAMLAVVRGPGATHEHVL